MTAPRRRRRQRPIRTAVALVVVFAIGLVAGEALHGSGPSGGRQTIVRTLDPLPLVPVERTVTVTTTAP